MLIDLFKKLKQAFILFPTVICFMVIMVAKNKNFVLRQVFRSKTGGRKFVYICYKE